MSRENLLANLSDEFATLVSFSASPPTTFTAPSVVVTPGDPFLQPSTHGTVAETWEVLVVASLLDAAAGITQLRELSLRVMRAVHKAGATWRSASTPLTIEADNNKKLAVSRNTVEFKYPPDDEMPEE